MMAAGKPSILIAAHSFPPAGGIGGRRWAKFAKYLQRAGCHVHVLSAKLPEANSPWSADVAHIARNTYNHHFPKILKQQPATLFQKLNYRLALYINNRKSDGSPYDRALFDKEAFLASLSQVLHRGGFDSLVVTAAPFRLPWYALDLRLEFPNLRFIADFRDPWTSGENYGYQHISAERKAFEAEAEAAVVDGYDLVCSPWPALVEELREKYPARASHIQLLPHCYDADELAAFEGQRHAHPPPHIVYGGNLYQGLDSVYQSLSASAARNEIQVDLWATSQIEGMERWPNPNFRLHKPIASKRFFEAAGSADALLFPIPELLRNGYPTKLLEYAATGLPLLAVGHGGSLSQMLIKRGLGAFHPIDAGLPNWQQMLTSGCERPPDKAWIASHEAKVVTGQLIDLILNKANA